MKTRPTTMLFDSQLVKNSHKTLSELSQEAQNVSKQLESILKANIFGAVFAKEMFTLKRKT